MASSDSDLKRALITGTSITELGYEYFKTDVIFHMVSYHQ